MSRGSNTVYQQFSPQVEIYSIDESFLNLSDKAPGLRVELARDLRATVRT
jgi:DNA polymerase V